MRNTSLEEELRSGKACVSTTVGDSMEPMLRNRKDTIIIEPVHGRLKRYDLHFIEDRTGNMYCIVFCM